MTENNPSSDRFRIDGNRLVVTSQFDPRFQRGSEGELLSTLEGLMEERDDGVVVLDMHTRDDLPSMLMGIIVEAHRRVTRLNRQLLLLLRPQHLKSLQWMGIRRLFDEGGPATDESGQVYLQFSSKPPSA